MSRFKLVAIVGTVVVAAMAGWFLLSRSSALGEDGYRDIARHGEDVSILVDFSISSAHPRMFVYDNRAARCCRSRNAPMVAEGAVQPTILFSPTAPAASARVSGYIGSVARTGSATTGFPASGSTD